jgi:hypothetical protein
LISPLIVRSPMMSLVARHGAVVAEREHIDRFDRVVERIGKRLLDFVDRHHAADVGGDRGVLEREADDLLFDTLEYRDLRRYEA